MRDFFSAVFLINLKRRPDRLEAALAELHKGDWPFREPQVVAAVDGSKMPVIPAWKAGTGAWGCRQSHLRILEDCIQNDTEPVLILEDDLSIRENFRHDCAKFIDTLPNDWDGLMLGGVHVAGAPLALRPGLVRCVGAACTHAYAVRGRLLRDLYREWASPCRIIHIDMTYTRLQSNYNVYAPDPFLISQSGSKSDISISSASEPCCTPPDVFCLSPQGSAPLLLLHRADLVAKQLSEEYRVKIASVPEEIAMDRAEVHRWMTARLQEARAAGAYLAVPANGRPSEVLFQIWEGPVIEVLTIKDVERLRVVPRRLTADSLA